MTKGKSNGNGNGTKSDEGASLPGVGAVTGANVGPNSKTSEAVRAALESRKDPNGNIVIEDQVEVGILCLFLLQKLGKGSSDDMADMALSKCQAIIDKHVSEVAMEALQARKIVSYSRGRRTGGENVKMWKLRSVMWSSPPEVAHVVDLLPALIATEEASKLIDALNAFEEDGDGEGKKKRGLVNDKYADIKVRFRTLDIILGSQPPSPMLDKLVKKDKTAPKEATLRFWRSPDGRICIPMDVIRGWVRTAIRTIQPRGIGSSMANYIACTPAEFTPHVPLEQAAFPVIDPDTREGKGLTTYEAIPAGQEFDVTFRVPTKGFMEPEDFVAFLAGYGVNPIRGISPARGSRTGRVMIVRYSVLNSCDDPLAAVVSKLQQALDAAEGQDGFPAESIALYKQLIERAEKQRARAN